jgi:YegS/Rv2252/BmrU family lipid kinase
MKQSAVKQSMARPSRIKRTTSAVVANPSKVTDLAERKDEICAALASAGWPEPLWLTTTPDDPGCGQTRQAIDAGVEVVFAFGGDGTVMACASELAGTQVAMAVLPSGTGNLLAANLSLPHDVGTAVAAATAGVRRRIDVGQLDRHCFTVMAGMGFDARMLESTPPDLKARIGWLAYVVGGLKHLRDRPMRLRIKLDDRPAIVRRTRSVLVANVGKLQGGIPLLPDAEPDDGMFDIAVISPRSLRHWVALAWSVMRRRPRTATLETFRASRVEIVSSRVQSREVDGDVIEPGRRLVAVVRPKALELCVESLPATEK